MSCLCWQQNTCQDGDFWQEADVQPFGIYLKCKQLQLPLTTLIFMLNMKFDLIWTSVIVCLVIQRAAAGEKWVCKGEQLWTLESGPKLPFINQNHLYNLTYKLLLWVLKRFWVGDSCGMWFHRAASPSCCEFLALILYFWFRFHDLRTQICENGIGILSWSFRERVKEERTDFSIAGPWVKTFSISCATQGL